MPFFTLNNTVFAVSRICMKVLVSLLLVAVLIDLAEGNTRLRALSESAGRYPTDLDDVVGRTSNPNDLCGLDSHATDRDGTYTCRQRESLWTCVVCDLYCIYAPVFSLLSVLSPLSPLSHRLHLSSLPSPLSPPHSSCPQASRGSRALLEAVYPQKLLSTRLPTSFQPSAAASSGAGSTLLRRAAIPSGRTRARNVSSGYRRQTAGYFTT